MLVLSRKASETLVIGSNITLTVLSIHGSKVKFGIEAPPDVTVNRGEVEAALRKTAETAPHRETSSDTAPVVAG
jgi:carbon storage regulator